MNYGAGGVPNGANIAFTVPQAGSPSDVQLHVDLQHVLTVLIRQRAARSTSSTPTAYWLTTQLHRLEPRRQLRTEPHLPALRCADGRSDASPTTGITGGTAFPLTYDPAGLPADVKAKFPAQAGLGALRLPDDVAAEARALLKGQVAVAAFDAGGNLLDATGLQIPGVLDDLYAGAAQRSLGPIWNGNAPTLALWAPTAQASRSTCTRPAQAPPRSPPSRCATPVTASGR